VERRTGEGETPGRFGLSVRLLVLTILFVMIAEVLIYVPSVANFRQNWLANRVSAAVTAALVLDVAPNRTVSDELAMQLLGSIGARMVVLKMNDSRRLLAASEMPPKVDVTSDLRSMTSGTAILQAMGTLWSGGDRVLRIVSNAPAKGEYIEIVMDERRLRDAMLEFSRNILLLSLVISGITAGLVFLALSWLIVRPMRRLTRAMVSFAEDPENPASLVVPSSRRDEIGVAERELAAMQRQLTGTLQQKTRLAALGLAVAKVSHDLRNLLSAAQLFSDRLTTSDDPMVQRFAPKLLRTLDRAIAFCQSTLSYGKAAEKPPARRMVPVEALVTDARELLGLGGEEGIAWREEIEPGLMIDADPDQLSRVLLNLLRNAAQAIEAREEAGQGAHPVEGIIAVRARRQGSAVTIEIADTGPGLPDKARQRLFEAFSGSARAGGAGLGLAIAAELVRAHGGSIAHVEGGRGATFRIVIPDRAPAVPDRRGAGEP
jgi:signal transduction histidine kinase